MRRGEAAGEFIFFAVGVGAGADMQKLAELSKVRRPKRLRGYRFPELLRWAASLSVKVSHVMLGRYAPARPHLGLGGADDRMMPLLDAQGRPVTITRKLHGGWGGEGAISRSRAAGIRWRKSTIPARRRVRRRFTG